MLAYAAAGKLEPALGMGVIVAFAFVETTLVHAQFRSRPCRTRHRRCRDIGPRPCPRLRRLHVTGMLVNGAVLGTVILGIPYVV